MVSLIQGNWRFFSVSAYRLVAGNDDPKYVPISPMDEDLLKADSGWNPFPKEPLYPKFDRRFPLTREINASIQVHVSVTRCWNKKLPKFAQILQKLSRFYKSCRDFYKSCPDLTKAAQIFTKVAHILQKLPKFSKQKLPRFLQKLPRSLQKLPKFYKSWPDFYKSCPNFPKFVRKVATAVFTCKWCFSK